MRPCGLTSTEFASYEIARRIAGRRSILPTALAICAVHAMQISRLTGPILASCPCRAWPTPPSP
jgi:hypothetical protein